MSFSGEIVPTLPVAGIDTSQGPQNIAQDACADCRNVRFWQGDIVQRGGYTQYISSAVSAAAPITGIFQMTFKSAATRFIAAAGTALVKDGGSGSWTSIKGTLTFTAGATNLFSFAQVNNLVIGANRVDQLWQYGDTNDPATAVTGSPPTNVQVVADIENRCVVLNCTWSDGTVSPARIGWSVINNPNDWANYGSGFAEPVLNAGQVGRGIGKVGNEYFIFFDRSIWRMIPTGVGDVPFDFTRHDATVGAVSHQSIATAPNIGKMYFVGPRGVYEMAFPGYRPTRISKPLDGIWKMVNKTRLNQVTAAIFGQRNEVWFSVPYGAVTQNNMVLVYDYERQAWTVFDNIAANFLAAYQDGSAQDQISHGDYAGFVFEDENGADDNGTAPTAYITSRAFPIIDGVRRGRVAFVELNVDAQSTGSNIQLGYAYDLQPIGNTTLISQDPGGDAWDDSNWDDFQWTASQQLIVRQNTLGQGRYFQYQLLNSALDDTFRSYRVSLGVISEKRITQ